ncbi:MAG: universal stress protein [Nitrospirae bacterium]|jgi:nucleotide-binding universal stress UspA family protein|nr:universal stress protein [Nitrospirota bacterium]
MMGIYRKILVAVNGSDASFHALTESFRLAGSEKSWITAVSVVPAYEGELELAGTRDIMAALRKPCDVALSKVKSLAEAGRMLVKTVCEEGVVYERIADLADAENSDLIVLGAREGGAGRHLGNTTSRVIGLSRTDVLVIPEHSTIGLGKIMVATDGSRFSHAATDRAIELARVHGGMLTVISVVDVPPELHAESPGTVDKIIARAKEIVEAVRVEAQSAGVQAVATVAEGEAHEVIAARAAKVGAELLVMGSHGRTGLRRLLMGSVTENVIGNAPCPVLVVR